MNMNITLHINSSPENYINKSLNSGFTREGTMRVPLDVRTPVITIEFQPASQLRFINYAYVEDLNRYYYVTNMVRLNNKLTELHLKCDVLMSFKNNILNGTYNISQHTTSDRYIINSADYIKNQSQQQTLFFPNSMNERSYLITVAGGESG